jgi:hypothetical protein
LLRLPEVADIGAKVNAAMREIEKHNPQLAGVARIHTRSGMQGCMRDFVRRAAGLWGRWSVGYALAEFVGRYCIVGSIWAEHSGMISRVRLQRYQPV